MALTCTRKPDGPNDLKGKNFEFGTCGVLKTCDKNDRVLFFIRKKEFFSLNLEQMAKGWTEKMDFCGSNYFRYPEAAVTSDQRTAFVSDGNGLLFKFQCFTSTNCTCTKVDGFYSQALLSGDSKFGGGGKILMVPEAPWNTMPMVGVGNNEATASSSDTDSYESATSDDESSDSLDNLQDNTPDID